MKRILVCRNEAARHPLRMMLPPPQLDMSYIKPAPVKWWKQEDTHLFMLSFTAFFIAISTFIN
jgi:hypothetical protein